MRDVSLWRALLGVESTVIERVEFDEDAELLVAHVRPRSRARSRCGACGRRCPGYDAGQGRRRWRSLDLGMLRAVLEANAPRVTCPEHGVVVARVPWARHDAGHTYAFEAAKPSSEIVKLCTRNLGAAVLSVPIALFNHFEMREAPRHCGYERAKSGIGRTW